MILSMSDRRFGAAVPRAEPEARSAVLCPGLGGGSAGADVGCKS
jgi:hypothetical protein